MKLIIADFGQETNTFSPDRLPFERFAPNGWIPAAELVTRYRGTRSYLGGAIDAAEEIGAKIFPIDSISSFNAGAKMTQECLDYCVEHLCNQVRAVLSEADGMYLGMHGAGGAEGVEDLEIHVLCAIRQVTGREFPIVSSLDIHCNLSQEMVSLSDGLFVIKEFPHTDMAEASGLAVRELVRMIETGKRPVMTLENLPLILPNTTTCTIASPMKEVREYFEAYRRNHGWIDLTMVQGFSANDQYWAGASVLAVADRDVSAEVKELALWFWEQRSKFDPNPRSAASALEEASQYHGTGYVVINESSDNPGSGCPGDGTHLLREMIRRNLPNSIFAFLYDPEVAKQAAEVGVGAKVTLSVGGKTVPICGEPVLLEQAEVMAVSDGAFRYVSPMNQGVPSSLGLTARLRHGNVDIIVASVRTQTLDDSPIQITNADASDYRIIALKSAGHFRAFFQERAAQIIPCEMPGLRSTNLKSYPYRKVRRPIYPLDDGVIYP